MFYKFIDKFFDEIKQAISIMIFAVISLTFLMLFYWIAYAAKLTLPMFLNNISLGLIGIFEPLFRTIIPINKIDDIMPILVAICLSLVVYLLNLLSSLIEDIHKKIGNSKEIYKKQLEKRINKQLHNSFIDELKKNVFMLVKIRIYVEKEKKSYLTPENDENIDTEAIAKEITYNILSNIKSNIIRTKGKNENSIYFLLTDFENSKTFFTELVSLSSKLIGAKQNNNLKISFGCATDIFENMSAFEKVNQNLEHILDLKQINKIVTTAGTKLYFETIYPKIYSFKLIGEYQLEKEIKNARGTSIYSMQRK